VIILTLLLSSPTYLTSHGFSDGEADLSPDIIIHNGEILTMEQSPTQVEAVAIQDESILAIGNESDILAMAGQNTRFIDLEGRTLLPGFIDSHSHWISGRHWTGWLGDRDPTTLEEAIESALRGGWTSVTEHAVRQELLDELRTLDQEDRLPFRVNAYLTLSQRGEGLGNWYQAYQPGQEFSSKLRIAGVKIFMDDWVTTWDHYLNQSELDTLVQEAHDLGFQIAIHSVVDNATDIVLNALESVLDGQSNQLYRHRIEHLVLLRDDQIERMADLGIIASFQLPWFNSDVKDYYQYPIYQEYSHLLARWRDIVEGGVPSIGNTDYPFSMGYNGSAMEAVSLSVTRIGELGLTPTDWMLNQTLTVEQALRLITIDAAYGLVQEDIMGSIKVGKLADLVILSDNPLTVPEDSLVDIEVLLTMVGGRIEYVKDGSGFPGPDTTQPPWSLLLPATLIFVSFVALVVFIIYRKKSSSLT
jgi:predicted amidohydrolase YtcJ